MVHRGIANRRPLAVCSIYCLGACDCLWSCEHADHLFVQPLRPIGIAKVHSFAVFQNIRCTFGLIC